MDVYYHPDSRVYQPLLEPIVNKRMLASLEGLEPKIVEVIRFALRVGDELHVPLYVADAAGEQCRILHVHYDDRLTPRHEKMIAEIVHEGARRCQVRVVNCATYWCIGDRLRAAPEREESEPLMSIHEQEYASRMDDVISDAELQRNINRARYRDDEERRSDAQWEREGKS